MRLLLSAFLVLGVALASSGEGIVKYDGYKVYRVSPLTEKQNQLLVSLRDDIKYNFWRYPGRIGGNVDVMVSPHDQKNFENMMQVNDMAMEVYIGNVQELIDNQKIAPSDENRVEMTWTQYHNLLNIHTWLEELARNHTEVSVINAGTSTGGIQMKGLKISRGTGRRAIMIEGTIHACEWLTAATVNYIINEIVKGSDPRWRRIADNYDWYVFPVTNPDGYTYSFNSDRLWRKSRAPFQTENGTCYGVDLNRNWATNWGDFNTSMDPCSNNYRGMSPFSERETQVLKGFIDSVAGELDMYLAMHTYGQYFLLPFANTTDHLGNYDDLYTMASAAALSLESKHGTKYTSGTPAEVLYAAGGISADWVNENHGVKVTYTYELRDNGTYGHLLPENQILPNCEEVMESLITLFEEGERLGYFNIGNTTLIE